MAEKTLTKTEKAPLAPAKKQIWVDPIIDCDCGCTEDEENNDVIRIQYEIPGVDKKDIHLKVIKDAIRLIAHKNDGDYINEFCFQCEVDTGNVAASYENGLLTVDVTTLCPDPFKDAEFLKIN